MSTRHAGIALAFVTAVVSGVAVFVNARGVSHFDDATVYTTAKNGVAGLLLLALALPLLAARDRSRGAGRPGTLAPRRRRLGLVAVACIGGSIPFVLFFEGLARADATQAAFIHKTLVVWVALLAVPLLGERLGAAHGAAIALVVAGQALLAGDPGTVAFGAGEAMILTATLLWAAEVIVAKRLLASVEPRVLAVARMGLGTLLLLGWVAASGRWGSLAALGSEQWTWAILTGLLLCTYVVTWYAALSRAPAVDVTAVLVFGAVVTALLSRAADGAALQPAGLALVGAGAVLVVFAATRRAHASVTSP